MSMIVLISPSPEEKRKLQQHARAGDVPGHHMTLAVDPANYPEN